MIAIRMLRACLVDGIGRAQGEKCKVQPAAAFEAVREGWAEYVDPADETRARSAYVELQRAMLGRLGRRATGWPDTPWLSQ